MSGARDSLVIGACLIIAAVSVYRVVLEIRGILQDIRRDSKRRHR